ncbi:MAG: hypothetical protein ACMUHU_04960 [Thermoplasmatota archaeon]
MAEQKEHQEEVFTLAFHPDGTRLATGGRDQAIRIWSLPELQELLVADIGLVPGRHHAGYSDSLLEHLSHESGS